MSDPTMNLTRTLYLTNPLMRGKDVKAAQTLLHSHGYYPGAIDGIFGAATGNACKLAKYRLGFATKDIKATYGATLNGLLAGTIKLPTAYLIRQKARRGTIYRSNTREAILRAKIVSNLKWMLTAHAKAQETYAQLRPIDGEHQPYKLPLHFDCSGSVTDAYSWAGATDPNNENYNGLGYTGTIMASPLMVMIHPSEVKPGDIGVYGYYPGKHEVCALPNPGQTDMLKIVGSDPLVFSMGKQGDPNEYKASTMLSIGPLHWYTLRKW